MKIKQKLAIAAVVAMASTGANAAWESASSGNLSNQIDGELILTVWNSDTNRSFSQDLGVRTTEYLTGAAALPETFAVNQQGIDFIGAGNIQYNIYGASSFRATSTDTFGYTFTSAVPVTGRNIPPTTFATVGFAPLATYETGLLNSNVNADNGAAALLTAEDPVFFLEGSRHAGVDSLWGNTTGNAVLNVIATTDTTQTAAGDGESLAAYITSILTSAPGQDLRATGALWTLDTSSASLSYTAVPLPAAAWLFGSALLGMIGAARRRKMVKA